jgi:hypothetical protein
MTVAMHMKDTPVARTAMTEVQLDHTRIRIDALGDCWREWGESATTHGEHLVMYVPNDASVAGIAKTLADTGEAVAFTLADDWSIEVNATPKHRRWGDDFPVF